jgi:hypothetical protein
MLAATAKSKRYLDLIQLVLSFASVCAVVDASEFIPQRPSVPGYYRSVPAPRETNVDRRIADLARVERQRREAEQHASRRAGVAVNRLTPFAA